LKIEDNVNIAAKSGIMKDIPANSVVGGIPHMDIKDFLKVRASLPYLYDLRKEMKNLKAKIEELEEKVKK
jgi:UDP-3-O-[3-hydroxymyristoyl] glucosamine N-acyltransferase